MSALGWLTLERADVPSGDSWLDAAEREAQHRLVIDKRRADWRLGRWTAKRAVAAFLKLEEPARVGVRVKASGAPEAWVDGAQADLVISISHSHERGFCCVSSKTVKLGCDLEHVETRSERMLRDFFTEKEIESLGSPPSPLYANGIWCAKESALKLIEEGLRLDTRSVAATLEPSSGAEWVRARVTGAVDSAGWWCERGGYVLCVMSRPELKPEVLR